MPGGSTETAVLPGTQRDYCVTHHPRGCSSAPVAPLVPPAKPSSSGDGWCWLGRQHGLLGVMVGATWWDRAWDRHRGVKGLFPHQPHRGWVLLPSLSWTSLEGPWLEEEEVSYRAPAKSRWVLGPKRSPRLRPREEQSRAGSVFEQAAGAGFIIPALKSPDASPNAAPPLPLGWGDLSPEPPHWDPVAELV